jgi:hypothetical protein
MLTTIKRILRHPSNIPRLMANLTGSEKPMVGRDHEASDEDLTDEQIQALLKQAEKRLRAKARAALPQRKSTLTPVASFQKQAVWPSTKQDDAKAKDKSLLHRRNINDPVIVKQPASKVCSSQPFTTCMMKIIPFNK